MKNPPTETKHGNLLLSKREMRGYVLRFDKAYNDLVFQRQEAGYLHNTAEWGSWIYDCLKRHDTDGIREALLKVNIDYQPGTLSREDLRSGKNLIVSLISVMVHFAVRDRIIDNELALTAADVCILLCEDTGSHEELLRTAYAGLCKISDLMQSYREREYHYLARQAKEYIFQHLHDEIRIKDMADALHVSAEHLSRTFHAAEKVTLKQYILEERVDRAKNLLRFSDITVAEISRYLAFSSQSHFAEIFKKYTGKSPTEYRQDYSDNRMKQEKTRKNTEKFPRN